MVVVCSYCACMHMAGLNLSKCHLLQIVVLGIMPRARCKKLSVASGAALGHLYEWGTPEQKQIVERVRAHLATHPTTGMIHQQSALKIKYDACAKALGKKSLDAMIKQEAIQAATIEVKLRSDKIAAAAVKKFKRSQDYKRELQQARMEQKVKDKKDYNQMVLAQTVSKMKKLLASAPDDSIVKAFGLHELKAQVDAKRLPESWPKWIDLSKHPSIVGS